MYIEDVDMLRSTLLCVMDTIAVVPTDTRDEPDSFINVKDVDTC